MKQILAALSFFTRLPFWRLTNIPARCYERVVPLWPLAGWLTGGSMLLTLWLTSFILPLPVCIVLMLAVRVLITGALHEDGFADFCDGFGGGTDRERTLAIMKDSHIGTYGVLGLVIYFLLLSTILLSLLAAPSGAGAAATIAISSNPAHDSIFPLCLVIPLADIFAKFCSSWIIDVLPYARPQDEAKTKLVYSRATLAERISSILLTALPFAVAAPWLSASHAIAISVAALAAITASALMFLAMHRRLQGYTGDCCGATFLVTELSFYLAATAVLNIFPH